MAYGTWAGMQGVFGSSRISQLADFDETGSSATIAANVSTALDYADDRIDAAMRQTHHRIPLVTAAGATPGLIASIANRLAGGYLARQWRLENVPAGDAGERVLQYEKEAMADLEGLASGALGIDAQ